MSAVWFGLETDGVFSAAFFDLTISTAVEPIEGEPPQQARPLPQRVTLAREHGDDVAIFAWYQSVRDSGPAGARRTCKVMVFDASGQSRGGYELERAWPFRFEVGLRQRDGEERLVETLTLACDRISRIAL